MTIFTLTFFTLSSITIFAVVFSALHADRIDDDHEEVPLWLDFQSMLAGIVAVSAMWLVVAAVSLVVT